jgi:hypothetical protein
VEQIMPNASDEDFDYGGDDDDPEKIPIINAFRKIPLFDNLFLHMQSTNIAITDEFLQDMEHQRLDRYLERERTPLVEAVFVSAWSQLWIFGVYEIIRTW